MHSKKFLLFIILLLFIASFVLLTIRRVQLSATLNIQVAPSIAKLTANGHGIGAGTNQVKPGIYSISATMNGFSNNLQTVTVKKGEVKTIGIVLTSNSPSTANWYATHPADQQVLEKISGKNFDSLSQGLTQNTSLIKLLPFIGPGFEFRIDYGNTSSGQVIIYITAPNSGAQQDAVTWIKNQGYDPTKLDIQYVTGQP